VLQHAGKGQRIEDDALDRHTAFARHLYTPMGEIEFVDRRRIRIDAHYAGELEGAAVPAPVEIEPPGVPLTSTATQCAAQVARIVSISTS
jgi:hypothetical protein